MNLEKINTWEEEKKRRRNKKYRFNKKANYRAQKNDQWNQK